MTTLLDAGYYHIRTSDVDVEPNTVLSGDTDTAYLVHLKYGKTLAFSGTYKGQPVEFADTGNKTQRYVLLRPEKGQTLLVQGGDIATITRLDFSPTKTQRRTLEYVLQNYGDGADRVSIMVDDLGLPGEISEHLAVLLPESYRTLLDEHNKSDLQMVSERKSRNIGGSVADRRIKRIGKGDSTPQSEYERTGFVVGRLQGESASQRSCANGTLVLCSPSIIDEKPDGKTDFVVGLDRQATQGTVPSCGVFEAGKIWRTKKDADHIISVWHTKDDPSIRYKNFDGAATYAWFDPKSQLKLTYVTLSDRNGAEKVDIDQLDAPKMRETNETSYAELLEELSAKHATVTPITNGRGVHVSSGGIGGASCTL